MEVVEPTAESRVACVLCLVCRESLVRRGVLGEEKKEKLALNYMLFIDNVTTTCTHLYTDLYTRAQAHFNGDTDRV